jgi:tetratricopeptide (TPR) repeat protein
MGRRKQRGRQKVADAGQATMSAGVGAPSSASAELVRHIVLGLLTLILVARPLILGEDPGLIAPQSGRANLILTLLWLVVAVGWAAWRVVGGQTGWYGSLVEVGLAGIVAAVFWSTGRAAAYRHPALLIAWEWVALFAAFVVVRQFVRGDAENRAILAVLLASAVSLWINAVYQRVVELPVQQSLAADPKTAREMYRLANGRPAADDAEFRAFLRRVNENNVSATFAHPNSFAGYLSLFLPAAVGAAWCSWRKFGKVPYSYMVTGAAALIASALALSQSKGAILSTLLVGGIISLWALRRRWAAYRSWVVAGMVILAGAGVALGTTSAGRELVAKPFRSFALRLDYWRATWAMIRDHFWLGVGPGSFGRFYPHYVLKTAWERIKDPHNLFLEMWATAGVFAFVALVVAVLAFFWRVRSAASASQLDIGKPTDAEEENSGFGGRTPWEYYLGGMAGLLIGFMVRASGIESKDEILLEGLTAGLRALVWFAALALYLYVPWTAQARRIALTAGVVALLLNLLVSGGIEMPSVAQSLWVVAALALNAGGDRDWFPQGGWLSRVLPLPLALAAAFAYFLMVFLPVTTAADALRQAQRNQPRFAELRARTETLLEPECMTTLGACPVAGFPANVPWKALEHARTQIPAALSIKSVNRSRAADFLRKQIIGPVYQALEADPTDANLYTEQARWYQEWWMLQGGDQTAREAIHFAERAQALDPESHDGYLVEAQFWEAFGERAQQSANKQQMFDGAARAMRRAVALDPNNAELHYRLGDVLFRAGRIQESRNEAAAAWSSDEPLPAEFRRLSEVQRQSIQRFVSPTR